VSRKLLHGAGELLVTLSVLIFLYFVYSAWFTNVTAIAKQTELSKEITKQFEVRDAKPLVQTESQATEVSKQVTPIGLLYIPRLQDKVWGLPIVQGVGHHELSLGVGHYPSTELPGELGNFAIAGHRATNGEPFAYFERLKADDLVYVRTQDGWFEYQLLQNKKIQESETWVLSDQPKGIDTEPNSALITLTTCDPRWNSYQRWAWWGVLTNTYPAAADPIGAEAGN
jgi:sortase A